MKRPLLLLLLCAAPAFCGAGENTALVDWLLLPKMNTEAARAPKLDPKRRINESNSFLKEREPEMTGEEYALYEQVLTMLTTNVDLAVKMLEGMVNEKEPPSPAFEFILANAYYGSKQADLAEKHYRNAVTRYPTFLRAWGNLGLLYYTANRYAEAIPCFSKAVALGDHEPATFGLLGYCLEHEQDVVSAEVAYMQALAGDPANVDWKEGLLRLYLEDKQYGRAEALVKKLLRENPAEQRYWLTYATVLLAEGRKLDATVVLETAAGARLAGGDELLLLGDLYAEQGLPAEAVAAYQQGLGPARDQGERKLLHYAQALIAAGKLAEAGTTLAALQGGEATPAGRLALLQTRADLLLAQKHWPEARRDAEALIALAPLNGRAFLTLGRTFVEENDLPRAGFAFESAFRIPESAYKASLELANLEVKNRRYRKAVAYLEYALNLQRTEEIEDYLARLKTLVPADLSSG